jgi:trehalose 6-phosphate phosphatase
VTAAPSLADALAPLRAEPRRAAILLDVDGTLAPIVRQAERAAVPAATRALVGRLAQAYGLVACVSGRRASEARGMVALGSVHYVGTHGAELLRSGWTEPRLDPKVAEWAGRIDTFAREIETPELRTLGLRREDKGPVAAFHWRGARDEDLAFEAAREISERAATDGFATHWGRKVLEIRPPVPMNKGEGIRTLLAEAEGIDAALYAGDDTTDLDAFRALAALRDEGRLHHLVRVGVASDEGPAAIVDEADVVVDGTDGVAALLADLAAE